MFFFKKTPDWKDSGERYKMQKPRQKITNGHQIMKVLIFN